MASISRIRELFPETTFETFEPEHDADLCCDIDFLGLVGEKALGIQIKIFTSKADIRNYSASERMRNSFDSFTEKFGGKVFVVFSVDDKIANIDVIKEIATEIKRLSI